MKFTKHLKKNLIKNKIYIETANLIVIALLAIIISFQGNSISNFNNELTKIQIDNVNKEKNPVFSLQSYKHNNDFSTIEIINTGGKIGQVSMYVSFSNYLYFSEYDLLFSSVDKHGLNNDWFHNNEKDDGHDYLNQLFRVNYRMVGADEDGNSGMLNTNELDEIGKMITENEKVNGSYKSFYIEHIQITYTNTYGEIHTEYFKLAHPIAGIGEIPTVYGDMLYAKNKHYLSPDLQENPDKIFQIIEEIKKEE